MKFRDADHSSREDPDAALMAAAAAGDEEAFVTLYRRYRDRIVSFTRRLLGNEAEAEEAAQDVFLKLYAARRRYVQRSSFSTYLFRIAANHCFNIRARKGRRLTTAEAIVDERGGDPNPDMEGALDASRTQRVVAKAIARLPENQGAAIVLCHYEGLSYREVARVLSVSEGAVKALVFRARQALANELKGSGRFIGEVSNAV